MLTDVFHKSVRAAQLPAIRAALVAKFGARKYRITKNGEIHAYGVMPSTNQDGWYLFGEIDSAETIAHLGL